METSSGCFYLVATPIGNLEDITLRALRILKEADGVYAEDTRHTALLLNHYQIRRPLQSCHDHNEARRGEEIAGRVERGEKVALVSDAGSPGISDPGFRAVRACVDKGLRVEAIPGPCALIAGLSASGLSTHEFHFAGFLPVKPGACEKRMRELLSLPGTLAIYESPYRIIRTLKLMETLAPDRLVVVARELTKKFEECRRDRPALLAAHFEAHPPKGEFVLLVAGEAEKTGEVD
ncbi:MAG: 16S rRNA (cytidine(1402)-2'-O)-methyltransferase [Verrucomicrobiae bacterium]|nr:16S rRNA (cytidine(1402)-2'-O)-methyltransferase [Verrucomicrobiae bacterium]